MPLFEIAVLRKWEDEDDKDQEELVQAPVAVLSGTDKSAALTFVINEADVLEKYDVEELEIIVRPFA